ncbi:MAG: gliding motility-associated C-terminal domain-containing protein [Bacteroidaceae bacterium]|nr:gliding motility-associated C-terminal domain-containing protein [Bacteroidaceae bacterium]
MKSTKISYPAMFFMVIATFQFAFPQDALADDFYDINPMVTCEYQDTTMAIVTDTVSFGGSVYCEAPATIRCTGNVEYDEEKFTTCICEWKISASKDGSTTLILDRHDEDVEYIIDASGSYQVVFSYTLIDTDGLTYSLETEPATITIKESQLDCPDGFSPNGDGTNDKFKMTKFQSIVSLEGEIYNRWGQVLHTFTLDNIRDGWDGYYRGKVVKDGGYILRIHAKGSEGYEYNIKKVINVLKGYRENKE